MKDANGNEIPGSPMGPPVADGFVPQNVEFADGPLGAAKKVYNNATRGYGPAGLVSRDGTVSGVADEALGTALNPMGNNTQVTAAGDLVNGRATGNAGMADAEVGLYPGTPGQMGGNEDDLDRMRTEMLMDGAIMGDNAKAPPKFYQDAHEEYSGVGGRRGKELFQTAYGDGPNDGPAKLQAAIGASEEAQSQKNEAMAKFYDQESGRATEAAAARKMSMQKDQAELQQRQAQMERAATYYTNDLADTGKFWTNPGNILAAISFSLMPIFSNDPTVGVKLINQAIQQDLDYRRQAAAGSLGALRSNLDGYHKIVGDRQAGDQLAEAEARRIAAMEVERISAKFESPISKAKAEAIIQDLRIKAAQGYMQAYSQAKIFSQASQQDPELYKRRTSGYAGAWQSMGVEDVAPIQPVGAAVNGSVGGSPSLAGAAGKNGGYTDHVSPEVRGVLRSGAPASVAAKLAMEGRVPGSANLFNMLSTYVNRQAVAKAKGVAYGPAFDEAKREIMANAKKEIDTVPGLALGSTKGYAGRKAALADLIASAEVIRASETAEGRDPNKFLGVMRNVIGEGFTNKYEELSRAFASKGGSPAEVRAQAREAAVYAFRQKLSMQISASYNDISGGAISATELPRLEASISGRSDFGTAYNWMQAKSKEIRDQEMQATSNLSPMAKMVYMVRTGVGQRPPGLSIRPTAGPMKATEGKGEYNAPKNATTRSRGGYSSYQSGLPVAPEPKD